MKRLPQLQWLPVRRLSRSLSAMLIAGLIASSSLLYCKIRLDARIALRIQQLTRVQELTVRMAPRPKAPLPPLSPAAARQLDREVALLNRDWSQLSNLLTPRDLPVSLLGMDVDPSSGAVRVSGSTESAMVANTYAEMLSRQGDALQQVRLLGVERRVDGIHFEISAQWID